MNHFEYVDGRLYAEDVAIREIADAVGTPAYVYSTATLKRHYEVFSGALEEACQGSDVLVCYSMKANSNQAVAATLASFGAGADVVSGGELARALKAGIPAEKIVFSGVGKTREEMHMALSAGIHMFNVESEPELDALSEVAVSLGVEAEIAVRINPDIDARTHAKISTGRAENKFGIPWDRADVVYRRAADLPGIRAKGIDMHIGSQLTELGPYEQAFQRLGQMTGMLRDQGHDITRLDLGGGLGIPYGPDVNPPTPEEYAAIVGRTVANTGCQLIFEPGRVITGNAGIMLSRVIYVKEGAASTFVILDSAMNDLVRPAMYDAEHNLLTEREPAPDTPRRRVDLVGPICETGDTFARDCEMPEVQSGDILAFESAGAYGSVMSSTYNSRPLAAEVLVDGDRYHVVRPRQTLEDLIGRDSLPPWLQE